MLLPLGWAGGAAHAQQTGDTADGLPGVATIGIPDGRPAGTWSVSASSGYGFTESLAGGVHHRLGGGLALSLTPTAGLDLGLRFMGRYDKHPADAAGADSGLVGDPRALIRYGGRVTDGVRLGAEADIWIPGKDAPSVSFGATTVDLRALSAFQLGNATTLTAMAGFRLDNSAKVKPDLMTVRPGDRTALGLSDFNAALVGVGLVHRVGSGQILAEAGADVLVGSDAPPLSQSPMRVTAGYRHLIGDNWQVTGLLQVSPSARPKLGPMDPLVPIEPRVSALFSLTYRTAPPRPATQITDPGPADDPVDELDPTKPDLKADPESEPDPEPAMPKGQLRGLVRSFTGAALRATVRIQPIGTEVTTDDEGQFTVDIPPGQYAVTISAPGFREQEREIKVEENGVTILNADLRRERKSP